MKVVCEVWSNQTKHFSTYDLPGAMCGSQGYEGWGVSLWVSGHSLPVLQQDGVWLISACCQAAATAARSDRARKAWT